jgi:hypothetical protein
MALNDDQQMEYDMLQAMYPEHLSEVTTSPDGLPAFYLDVSVDVDAPVELRLNVVLPPAYPSEAAPKVAVESISTSRRVQTEALLKQLRASADENIGTHCIAILLQTAQEYMRDIDSGNSRKEETSTDVDPTIRLGRSVTRDLFDDWRLVHRAAKAARIAIETAKMNAAIKGKLTGRQLWDKTIKEADWTLFAAEADAVDGDDIEYDFADADGDFDGDAAEE